MRDVVYFSILKEQITFAKKALKHFEENEDHYSFGDLEAGSLLALRWGMSQDNVLILKLDNAFNPVVYVPDDEFEIKQEDVK